MKPRCLRTMAVVLAALLAMTGCTFETAQVSGVAAEAGAIWVEPADEGGFRMAALPAERRAPVEISIVPAAPSWYAGPGVYVLSSGGYALELDGAGLTLDDVLNVWDPAPSGGR